jgi:F0F1-type ATP synthase membrane subunit b/b'
MEIGIILEVIGTLGFPIACVLGLGFFIYQIWKQSVERENKLFEEITESRAINAKFADIIAQYEVKLDDIRTDVKDIKDTLHITHE